MTTASTIDTAGSSTATATGKAAGRTATRGEPKGRLPERGGRDRGPILSRSGKPVELRITGDIDPFYIPPEIVPEGWTYEWKAKSVYNFELVQHQVTLGMNGWEPVPASRHDGMFMPKGYDGPIERGGQILMERDDRLTAKSRELDRRRAMEPVISSRQMAGLMPPSDIADFNHAGARSRTGVRVERQPVVESGKYEYSIDE